MCQWTDNVGYKQCNLYKDGKKKYVRVHRLVAELFVPNPNNLPQVNHIDGNKLNNHYTNLEWVNNSQNTKHAFDNGLISKKRLKCRIGNNTYDSIREASEKEKINRKTLTEILYKRKENNYGIVIEFI
jgi:uncharacterized HNH endonuclease L245